MQALGYEEGRHFVIEFRWADGKDSDLPRLAAELVALNVRIVWAQGTAPALAAAQATTMIPIVCPAFGGPVADGLAWPGPAPMSLA